MKGGLIDKVMHKQNLEKRTKIVSLPTKNKNRFSTGNIMKYGIIKDI